MLKVGYAIECEGDLEQARKELGKMSNREFEGMRCTMRPRDVITKQFEAAWTSMNFIYPLVL